MARFGRDEKRQDFVVAVGEDLWVDLSVVDDEGTAVDCTSGGDATVAGLIKASLTDADADAIGEFAFSDWAGSSSNETRATWTVTATAAGLTLHYSVHVQLHADHSQLGGLDSQVAEGTISVERTATPAVS